MQSSLEATTITSSTSDWTTSVTQTPQGTTTVPGK
ncbi:rCG36242, partial [Rattus norvegicus]